MVMKIPGGRHRRLDLRIVLLAVALRVVTPDVHDLASLGRFGMLCDAVIDPPHRLR
jgi:hypothetical protein